MFKDRLNCQPLLTKAFFGNKINHFRFIEPFSAALLAGGMIGGGLLSKTKQSSAKIPVPVGGAMSHLFDVAQKAETAEAPLREILPMTDDEKIAYEGLSKFLGSDLSTGEVDAQSFLSNLVKMAGSGISQMPEVQALLNEIEKKLGAQLSRTNRAFQKGGMAYSTPQGKSLALNFEDARKNAIGQLLPYQMQLLGLGTEASGRLATMGEAERKLPLEKLSAVSAFNLPRTLNQQKLDEAYNQIMNTQNLQLNTAGQLFGNLIGTGSNLTTVKNPSSSDAFTNALLGGANMASILQYLKPTNQTVGSKMLDISNPSYYGR